MKILLISGHGNGDIGAVGNGYKESDLNIELAKLLKTELEKYECTPVLYDVNKNAYTDAQTGKFTVKGYDYVFEVHFNSFTDSNAKGTEIYITNAEKGDTVEKNVVSNLSKYFTNRGVKRKDFSVIATAKNQGVSSALLETCFISNANDVQVYQANKKNIAQDIALGITSGFGLKRKEVAVEISKEQYDAVCKERDKYKTMVLDIESIIKR